MKSVSGGPVPARPCEIRSFVVVRNEALRLPFMLDYHFNLGVDRVILLDNGSSDATLDIAAGRPNVHVFQTHENYHRHGTWFDALMHRYGVDHWCWMADADELLVYPNSEQVKLPQLCRYLNSQGYNAMSTLLVDMYPDGPTASMTYVAGEDFRSGAPYFDKPAYRKQSYAFRNCQSLLDYRFVGGVRERVFGQVICCTNFPLVRFHPRMFLPMGRHAIEGASIADIRGAILHFKFFQDFTSRASLEATRGQHWNQAAEYKVYARNIEKNGDINLMFPGSIRYRSVKQLGELGIVQTTHTYERFVSQMIS